MLLATPVVVVIMITVTVMIVAAVLTHTEHA
jgi:hypothetical protein